MIFKSPVLTMETANEPQNKAASSHRTKSLELTNESRVVIVAKILDLAKGSHILRGPTMIMANKYGVNQLTIQ
jgi:hypothetical protein